MQTPHGLWLDNRPGREPSLVVADRANARLQYFTLDGKHLELRQRRAASPPTSTSAATCCWCPTCTPACRCSTRTTRSIVHLGDDPKPGPKKCWPTASRCAREPEALAAGKFIHPHDACFDKDGNIFVVEWVPTGRVTMLRKLG